MSSIRGPDGPGKRGSRGGRRPDGPGRRVRGTAAGNGSGGVLRRGPGGRRGGQDMGPRVPAATARTPRRPRRAGLWGAGGILEGFGAAGGVVGGFRVGSGEIWVRAAETGPRRNRARARIGTPRAEGAGRGRVGPLGLGVGFLGSAAAPRNFRVGSSMRARIEKTPLATWVPAQRVDRGCSRLWARWGPREWVWGVRGGPDGIPFAIRTRPRAPPEFLAIDFGWVGRRGLGAGGGGVGGGVGGREARVLTP